ncbi:oligosaccharide flippase family protein [Pluralibacter gergoviae]|nr:oligosaccharide flippase family protein [Pluralibacter gergoviae]
MKSNKNTVRGIVWFFFSNLFPACSALLIFSLASRLISPSDLGAVAFATTIATILTSFCAVGFGDALIQKEKINFKHLETVLFLCVFFSFSIYIISNFVFIFSDYHVFNGVFRDVYPFISIKIIIDSCAIVPLSYLTREMEFKSIALRTIFGSVMSFLLCIPIIYFGGGVWAIVVSQLTTSFVSFTILMVSAKIKFKIKFNKLEYNELSRFGITTTITKLITSINIDNLLIGFLANATTLGLYAFSRRIFSVLSDILNNAIANVSYPLYSARKDNIDNLREVFFKTTFMSALISLPAFCGLILIVPYLIPLAFGQQWSAAVPVVQLCCCIGLISCIGALQMSLIKGLGHTGWILKYQIIQQLLTAIVVIIFAKSGATILMLAITIKTICVWPLSVGYVLKLLDVGVFKYLSNFMKPMFAVILMVCLGYFLEVSLINNSKLLVMFIIIISSFVVYILLTFLIARKDMLECIRLVNNK